VKKIVGSKFSDFLIVLSPGSSLICLEDCGEVDKERFSLTTNSICLRANF
jgi:hypothetical protein